MHAILYVVIVYKNVLQLWVILLFAIILESDIKTELVGDKYFCQSDHDRHLFQYP